MIAHFGTKKIEFRIKNNTSLRKYCFYPLLLLLAISFVSCSSSNTYEASPASASLPESEEDFAVDAASLPESEASPASASLPESEASPASASLPESEEDPAVDAASLPESEEDPAVVAASVPIETQDHLLTAAPSPHPVPISYKKYPMPEVKTSSEPSRNTKPLPSVSDTAPGKTDNGLRLGKVAWNTPKPIQVFQSAEIEVKVTLDPERFKGIANRITSSGTITTVEANLSDDLTATLIASSGVIEINPSWPQRQNVLHGRDAQWTWNIYPKIAGNHILTMTIQSHIGKKVTYKSFSHKIFVKALPPPSIWERIIDFLRADWVPFLTVVMIPIGGWLYSIYIKRRKSRR